MRSLVVVAEAQEVRAVPGPLPHAAGEDLEVPVAEVLHEEGADLGGE